MLLYFLRGGRVTGGLIHYLGFYSRYWSSTSVSDANAYNLGFAGSNIYPSDGNRISRHLGFSLRCVAQ